MDSGRPFFSGQEAKQRQVGVYAEIFGACVEDISGCLLGGDGLPVRVRFQVFVREVREQFSLVRRGSSCRASTGLRNAGRF